jgi:hypothetical protein
MSDTLLSDGSVAQGCHPTTEINAMVNGRKVKRTVPNHYRVIDFIREELKLTGNKEGCGAGECGTCSMFVDGKLIKSRLFGPTCDSIDLIADNIMLPELAIGEWVYVENFGAYTVSASSGFNGFKTNIFKYYGVFTNPVPMKIMALKEKLQESIRLMLNRIQTKISFQLYTFLIDKNAKPLRNLSTR